MNRHWLLIPAVMTLVALVGVSSAPAGIIQDLAAAKIMEDFQFNDAQGTLWSAAANSANPGNLLVGSAAADVTSLAAVVTNGAGALDASTKTDEENGRMLVDLPVNIVNGRALGVMEMTWNFDPAGPTAGQQEELRITLISSGTTGVAAEWEIQREEDDTLRISGAAVGAGSSNIAPVVINGGSLTQSTKFIAVVDAYLTQDKYYVHYSSDGGSSFTTLGPANLDPARVVDKMRIYLNNNFAGDNVLVDRAYLAYVPEPASGMLLLLGASLLTAVCRRK